MDLKKILLLNNNYLKHHAFLMVGERSVIRSDLFRLLKENLNIDVIGNSDLLHIKFDSIGIDEGRMLKEIQLRKANEGGKRYFIIETNSITYEAQNSLLKVFEDPAPDVQFFLLLPSDGGLLPTLRSRFHIVDYMRVNTLEKSSSDRIINSKRFLECTISKRIALIKDLGNSRGKKEAFEFMDRLEGNVRDILLIKNKLSIIEKKQFVEGLKEIAVLKHYLQGRAPSVKLILEHLAIALPVAHNVK